MKTQYKNYVIDLYTTRYFKLGIDNEWNNQDKCISFGLGFIRFEITDIDNEF